MREGNSHNNVDVIYSKTLVGGKSALDVDFFVKQTRHALSKNDTDVSGIHFIPLAPLEKGFFTGIKDSSVDKGVISELYNLLASKDEKKILARISKYVPVIDGKRKREQVIKTLPSGLESTRITHLQNGQYDYFEELKKQYKFYLTGEASGHYSIARPGEDMNTNEDSSKPSILFIVEGIHSLGVGNCEDESQNEAPSPKDVSVGRIKSRIRQLKGEECLEGDELKKWEYPPLLVRLAGHFGNGLFGHARSFPECTKSILDQKSYRDKGVVKTSGYEIVCELLGLDEQLQPTGSRRILIDMAQLSASARNDLYQRIFRRFNKNISPEHPIPVVFTEAAYSGVDTLAEMTKNAHDGLESDTYRVNNYNGNSINLSDEDILEVFRSHGLISLSLEENRMGSEPGGLERFFSNSSRAQALRLLSRQVAGIVSVPFAYNVIAPLKVWDYLNIGSALTEKGDRLERYRGGSCQPKLEEDLEEVLTKLKKEEPMWFGSYKPDALVRKMCRQNISDFVFRNF